MQDCFTKHQHFRQQLLETVKKLNVGAGLPRDSVDLHKTETHYRGINPLLQMRGRAISDSLTVHHSTDRKPLE
ncbi:MAG: hypothetical protein ACI92G_000534 [Candidatus Pelagisphaera sp.]|jgi:hypothetical protein